MDIIRTTSYHRREFDIDVLTTNPLDHDQIRSSLLQTISATSSTLGDVELLLLEVIPDICSLLDIQSLFNFRHVNCRALQIVTRTRGYEAVITHATGALCVILRTKIASWFTMSDLFKALCTRDCAVCSSFGGFIFLPSFMRCCYACLTMNRLPSVVRDSILKNLLKPSQSHLRSLVPTVTSLPGRYTSGWMVRHRRYEIMPIEFVGKLSPGRWWYRMIQSEESLPLKYMVTTSLPYLDVETGALQNGIRCSGCDVFLHRTNKPESPSFPPENPLTLRDKVYSYDEFMEHFRECREAQNLWKLSKQGINAPDISRFFMFGGGYTAPPFILEYDATFLWL